MPRRGVAKNPDSVAAFYAENGSLSVNNGPPAVGRAAIVEEARGFMTNDGLIGESKGHFDAAGYERQLKHGVAS